MDVLLVSHTHWDREWYRTFEAFRARLVDTVDRVLELLAADPGWRFVLDGQSIVVEDYLEVRPGRRAELEAAVRAGRLAIGPWYVQPDSLLPSGELHVRNLLEGRRVAETVGGCSEVAYTPDSFGHPAQFPQLFAGFGLDPFVHWRGDGAATADAGPVTRWVAPDGTAVTEYHLGRGYFSAACLPEDARVAAEELAGVLERLGPVARGPAVLMNGIDHTLPDSNTAAVAAALEARTGRVVRRGLLDDLRHATDPGGRLEHTGELLGARTANLLPGVWSARLGLKLANRAAEDALVGWAEPWAAVGAASGAPDERPSLRRARRALLQNDAHDSIGGCSQDRVHRQMAARYDTARELADETSARVLERLAGLGVDRRVPWSAAVDVAVFNPTPSPVTDVARVRLDAHPVFRVSDVSQDLHPLALGAGLVEGYTAEGAPVRTVDSEDPGRLRLLPEWPARDVELVVADVPAFGWRRVHLEPGPASPDEIDAGTRVRAGEIVVEARGDGTLDVTFGERTYAGLAALEDRGDRGDTYDFDPVDEPAAPPASVAVTRLRHASGLQRLRVERTLAVPVALDPDRLRRAAETVPVVVTTEARVAPGVTRVDLRIRVTNPARDHRLRMLFPTGAALDRFRAATTFGVADRSTAPADDRGWVHPAPATFPHQGWVEANGLVVRAPGLPEAEVRADGTVAVTLLRAVGWLSRIDVRSRPIPAGPALVTPEAQCPDGVEAHLSLRVARGAGDASRAGAPSGLDPVAAIARADDLGLRAVVAGPEAAAIVPPGRSLLHLSPAPLVLSAVKPAEDGEAVVVRVLNPTDAPVTAELRYAPPFSAVESVRLDECPDGRPVARAGATVRCDVPGHGLRSLRFRA